MDIRIPPRKLKITLESNPLKSRIVVGRLAVSRVGFASYQASATPPRAPPAMPTPSAEPAPPLSLPEMPTLSFGAAWIPNCVCLSTWLPSWRCCCRGCCPYGRAPICPLRKRDHRVGVCIGVRVKRSPFPSSSARGGFGARPYRRLCHRYRYSLSLFLSLSLYIYIYIYMCIHICIHIMSYIMLHYIMYVYMHICIYIYIYTCIYIYIYRERESYYITSYMCCHRRRRCRLPTSTRHQHRCPIP